MKRYIVLLLAVFVVLAMVGCGGGNSDEKKQIDTTSTQTHTSQTATSTENESTSLPPLSGEIVGIFSENGKVFMVSKETKREVYTGDLYVAASDDKYDPIMTRSRSQETGGQGSDGVWVIRK